MLYEIVIELGSHEITDEMEDLVFIATHGNGLLFMQNGKCFVEAEIDADTQQEAEQKLLYQFSSHYNCKVRKQINGSAHGIA